MRARLLLLMAAVIGTLSIGFGLTAQARIDNDPDCDTVAIIKCGAFSMSKVREKYNNDGLYKDQPKVFAAFGISKSELEGSFEEGIVYRDGRVTVGGKVVATNAKTAGRWNNPTSDMTKISGTERAYKMSTSHFVDEGQTAFVKMVNGEFKFAIMKSCGNPVSATAKPKPIAECKALTVATLSRTKFRFDGSAHTVNSTVKSFTFVVKKGGTTVDTKTITTEKDNMSYEYTQAIAGSYTVTLTVDTTEGKKTSSACNANFTVKEEATPDYSCDKLTITKLTDSSWKFATTTTAKNATLKSIEYVVTKGGAEVSRSASTTYNQTAPGTYSVQAYATFTVAGADKKVTADACKGTIVIEEKENPAYACTKLTITKLTDSSWKFATSTSATGGATLKKTEYVVTKDGQEVSRSTNDTYNQTAPGTYTVQSFVTFTVDGADKTVTADACKGTIVIKETPAYTCDKLTVTKLTDSSWKFATATTLKAATLKQIEYVVTKNGAEVSRSTDDTYTQTAPGTYTVQAFVTVTVDGADKTVTADACKATIVIKENPVYACDLLTVSKLSDTSWKFATKYSSTAATFKKLEYVVTDKDGKELSRSANDTYTQTAPGTYNVQVFVTFTVDGMDKTVTADACKGTFTVNEKPKTPAYTCDKLTVTLQDGDTRKFATSYTIENVSLKKIEYVVTKGGAEVSRSTNDTYTQATAGAYTVQSYVTVTVNNEDKTVTSDACKVNFTITEYCDVPGKETLPKDSPLCKEDEKCIVPGKEHLPKDSPDCKETPKELPKTGPAENAMAIIGLGALVVSTGYYISSRRALQN